VIETRGSTKKVVVQAIAIGVGAFMEQLLTGLLQRLLDWAKARRPRERQARIKPHN
jgi:hypothetical protein